MRIAFTTVFSSVIMRLYAFLVTLFLQLAVLGHAFQDTYNRYVLLQATQHKKILIPTDLADGQQQITKTTEHGYPT